MGVVFSLSYFSSVDSVFDHDFPSHPPVNICQLPFVDQCSRHKSLASNTDLQYFRQIRYMCLSDFSQAETTLSVFLRPSFQGSQSFVLLKSDLLFPLFMCICPEPDQLHFLHWKDFLLLFLSEITFFSFYTEVCDTFPMNVHVWCQLKPSVHVFPHTQPAFFLTVVLKE